MTTLPSRSLRASEVRPALKSGQPVANSGPGVRRRPTPSPTAGRKPEAGPPVQKAFRPSHPKSWPGGSFKEGGWNPPSFLPTCQQSRTVEDACDV